MDPDPDPGGPKTRGSGGSGSATLSLTKTLTIPYLFFLSLYGRPDPFAHLSARLQRQQKAVAFSLLDEDSNYKDDVTRRLLFSFKPPPPPQMAAQTQARNPQLLQGSYITLFLGSEVRTRGGGGG